MESLFISCPPCGKDTADDKYTELQDNVINDFQLLQRMSRHEDEDYTSLDLADCSIEESSMDDLPPVSEICPVGSAVAVAKLRKAISRIDTSTTNNENNILPERKTSSNPNNDNTKILKYLRDMIQSKKEREQSIRDQEKRSKKRAQIISVRIYNESIERKNMSKHDKYMNGIIPSIKTVSNAKPSLKITPELSDSIYNRLVAKQQKSLEMSEMLSKVTSVSNREYTEWKIKRGIPVDQKVFIISGWYPCVKEALIQRGWYYSSDYSSPFFDMKWSNKTMDIEHDILQPWQLTNHFTNNITMTTKVGLLKSLESLRWTSDMDASEIIPRAYDLSNEDELEHFVSDFQHLRAENILKNIYYRFTQETQLPICSCYNHSTDKIEKSSCLACSQNLQSDAHTPIMVNKAIFRIACNVLERYLSSLDVNNIDTTSNGTSISTVEWEVLLCNEFDMHELPIIPPDFEYYSRNVNLSTASQNEIKKHTKLSRQLEMYRLSLHEDMNTLISIDKDSICNVRNMLCQLSAIPVHQSSINGSLNSARNIWIVKPAAKSRGRGICAFTDLSKLLKYVDAGTTISAQNLWVVQKYIENPLVIANRKFDLRQWVLVTDWNPLTIYFYDEFYARFSVEEYAVDDSSLENTFIHLVNNSIGKHSEKFHEVVTAENGDNVEGFMWNFESFSKYIDYKTGKLDYVVSEIQPRMREIVVSSLSCGCDSVNHRKNSWELYGFDFMIDDELKTWLIEINSSPACDYSTKTTEIYVKKALVDILSVVIDLNEWEKKEKDSRGDRPHIGGWAQIHKGPILEVPLASFGADIGLKGNALKCPPKKTILRSFGGFDKPIASSSFVSNFAVKTVGLKQNYIIKRSSANDKVSHESHTSHGSLNDSDSEDEIETIVLRNDKARINTSVRERSSSMIPKVASRRLSGSSHINIAIPIKTFSLDL